MEREEERNPPKYKNSLLLAIIAAAEKHPNANAVPTNAVTKILGSNSTASWIRGPMVAPWKKATPINRLSLFLSSWTGVAKRKPMHAKHAIVVKIPPIFSRMCK